MTLHMTSDRVFELIAAYGAEPTGWPDAEREAAEALITDRHEDFAEALEQALFLDSLLDEQSTPEPSDTLYEAVLAAAPDAGTGGSFSPFAWIGRMLPQGARFPTGAVLGSLVLGMASGYAYASTSAITEQDIRADYADVFSSDLASDWSGAGGLNDG